jgi:hypothetical protein
MSVSAVPHRFDGFAPRLLGRESADTLFRVMHKEEWSPIATALAARTAAMQRLAEQLDRTVEIVQGASVMLLATAGRNLASFLSGRKRTEATTITK